MAIVDGLCTLAEARASLNIPTTAPTTDDADIEKYVTAVTPLIEQHTGPLVARSRTFTVDGNGSAIVLPIRFTAVTSVTESGTLITDYVADPEAGIIYAGQTSGLREFTTGTRNIVVVVTVGSASIPANVTLAARELVRHLWQLGRQGNRPAFGNEVDQIGPQGFAMPRRVLELLEPNMRLGGFA